MNLQFGNVGGDPLLEYVPCVICGRDDADVFVQGTGRRQIVKCRRDGLLYLNPRPSRGRVRELHSQYVRSDNLEMFDRFRREVLAREAGAIKRLKTGGNLLDVGCATGTFFENFPPPEWRLFGVETSPLGAELARERYGAQIFCGELLEAGFPPDFFDVITILDTLYYVPDPATLLVEVRRILKTGGLLAVEIPGLRYRFFRDRGPLCWVLDRKWARMCPDSWHLYYFSGRTFSLLLRKCGFRVIGLVPEQASAGQSGFSRKLNDLHFFIARALLRLTGGWSIAAKELYLAAKTS